MEKKMVINVQVDKTPKHRSPHRPEQIETPKIKYNRPKDKNAELQTTRTTVKKIHFCPVCGFEMCRPIINLWDSDKVKRNKKLLLECPECGAQKSVAGETRGDI